MLDKSLTELAAALARRDFSCVELTRYFLQRIEQHNADLNAFITVCDDEALAAAERADEAHDKGEAGPLTGVPIAHKDIFCTRGQRTTCGSKMLANYVAPYDATVVARLNRAGTVLLGKTNMDEFAMGSSNENSYFGAVKNPWDASRVPGGSSGGSAAAVAARLAPAATGTDTGGSIRQPASFCGITGIKPTYGTVSRYGMVAFGSSLDQGGVFAESAHDCALLLGAMAGFDPQDSTSIDRPRDDYMGSFGLLPEHLRIGLPRQFFSTDGIQPGVLQALDEARGVLEKLGATFVDIDLPHQDASIAAYYVVAPAEASSNLSRYDGVRYGHRAEDPTDLDDLYRRSRSEGFGDEVKRRIMVGTYALSAGYYDAYYRKAQQLRTLISQDYLAAFNECDFILGPVAPTTAFRLGENVDDPVAMYLNDVFTLAVNLVGLPGMSVPCGFSDNLPVGMQLIGRHFDERGLFNLAHWYQRETDWHRQRPAMAGEG